MSREMDEYGIPGEEHVSDQEIWEVQQRYADKPWQARAALRNMGYDGPQLDNCGKQGTASRTPKLDALRASLKTGREDGPGIESPDF